MAGADGELVRRVIAQLVQILGGSDPSSERAAEEKLAGALGVSATQFGMWREDPVLTPLDYRLAMSLWIESAGRSARVDSLRDLGSRLRVATQMERAAHMVAGSVRYAEWPKANRADLVLAYAEVQCRRSPPPSVPIVDEYPLRVMHDQLLARDEQHFAVFDGGNDLPDGGKHAPR